MSMIIDGTNGLTFNNATTQASAGLPLTGGNVTGGVNISGNVGIGTTSPTAPLDVQSDTGSGAIVIRGRASGDISTVSFYNNANTTQQFFIQSRAAYTQLNTVSNIDMYFATNNTERMRITSGGNFLVGGTTPIGSDGNLLANADYTATYRSTTNTGAYIHAFASDIGGTRTVKYAIYANGTAGAVSDQNLKKNIEPARNYLSDLMNIKVVKYNWKSDEENAPKELGYIAQQVETVFAGMIDEQTYNDGDGNLVTQKMLKKEVFIPMMLKAIQELNAKVDAQAEQIKALVG